MKRIVGLLLLGIYVSAPAQAVTLGGFGEVGWNYSEVEKRHKFFQGALDMYLTSKLGDNASFLSETVFESNEAGEAVLDVERVLVQYHVSPLLIIAAGRFHTGLGYWNDTFHHGTWLQTPVKRPRLYNFEDENGILPVHAVGLEFRGESRLGLGNFGYVANIANGRGPKADPPQVVVDADNTKAMNLVLYYTFPTLSNLRIGGTVYHDTMPGGTDPETGALPSGKEWIVGAHVAWQPEKFELLAEVLRISHTYSDPDTNANASILGTYIQVFYQLTEKLRPYARIEYLGIPDGPDVYSGINSLGNYFTGGVRYDLTQMSALKLEYERVKNVNQDEFSNNVNVNWSFAF